MNQSIKIISIKNQNDTINIVKFQKNIAICNTPNQSITILLQWRKIIVIVLEQALFTTIKLFDYF